MRVHEEAEAVLREVRTRRLARRPKHSREPAFQMLMAFVHGFCAVMSVGGCVYHLLRAVRKEDAPDA